MTDYDKYIINLSKSKFGTPLKNNISDKRNSNESYINSVNKNEKYTESSKISKIKDHSDNDSFHHSTGFVPNVNFCDILNSSNEPQQSGLFDIVAINPNNNKQLLIARTNDVTPLNNKTVSYDPTNNNLIIQNKNSDNLYYNLCEIEKGAQMKKSPGLLKLNEVMCKIREHSDMYNARARIYKYINYMMCALLLGDQIAMFYINQNYNKTAMTILIIIAMILTGIYFMFKIGSRGKTYREYAKILNDLYRKGGEAKRTFSEDDDIYNFADTLEAEMDELSLEVFNMSYGPDDPNNVNSVNNETGNVTGREFQAKSRIQIENISHVSNGSNKDILTQHNINSVENDIYKNPLSETDKEEHVIKINEMRQDSNKKIKRDIDKNDIGQIEKSNETSQKFNNIIINQ